jgi:4-amino-4-deoxy-L-arabinose transferase-like glycosyltransferase
VRFPRTLVRPLPIARLAFGAPLWLFLFALGVRLAVVGAFRLDGLTGQDAFAYLQCGREILHLHPGELPCSDFYWPWGYPLLAALFMFASQSVPFGAQLASMVAGAALAPLTYWLVSECVLTGTATVQQRNIACAAGLIVALGGVLMLSSVAVMSDAPGLFWATLSACLLLRWRRRSGARNTWPLLLAATALALAIVTRWIYAAVLLPFGVFVIATIHRELGRLRLQHHGSQSPAAYLRVLPLVLAACLFFMIVSAQVHVTRLASTPLLDRGWLADWSLLNAVRTSFENPEGHFSFRMPPVIFYATPLFHPLYLFPLLTACVFNGVWQLRRSHALLLLGGWFAAIYLYLIGIPQENLRFPLALYTPVAVFASVGIFCIPLPSRWPLHTPARWLLLAAALLAALPFSYRALARFHAAAASQLADIRYLQSQLPAAATVITFELSISLDYYTHLKIVDLYAQSPQSLRPLVCGGDAVYVYVREQKLESQWAAQSPARNFHWLRDQVGLQQIGLHGDWTLYRALRCTRP